MGRERMSQTVWVRKDPAQRRRVEPLAARRDEHGVLRVAYELRPRLVQVARKQMPCLFAKRHDPLLAALAPDVELLPVEVDVREVEPHGLRATQPGRVD